MAVVAIACAVCGLAVIAWALYTTRPNKETKS